MSRFVNWSKLSQEHLSLFRQKMAEGLTSVVIPVTDLLHGDKCCNDDSHKLALENYYCDLVNAILYAESFMPTCNPICQRSFWNPELTDLKKRSIDCNNYWKSCNSPKSGPVFECKQKCHYFYKAAVRKHKRSAEKQIIDNLHIDLVTKNSVSFWRTWRSVNGSHSSIATRIDGETDEKNIAEAFGKHFASVYNSSDSAVHQALKDEFQMKFSSYLSKCKDDSLTAHYLSWSEMVDIAVRIKLGKSSSGSCKPEHIIHGCSELLTHFHLLFNGLIQHGFVPTDFLRGSITPIVKDMQGDTSSSSNYRPITLGCLPAKLFEFAIKHKTAHLLETDDLQFGFKRKTSTSHAMYTLKTTIDYYNARGSPVFVAFLDCTKAFDRVSHYAIFSKLIDRKIPLCFLLCLMFWYLNMTCNVRWGSETSCSFAVPLGVKQGGVNSPDLFGCYVDGIIGLLREKKIGCHIFDMFLAVILFEDDICLLAPTRSSLQSLVSLCTDYCQSLGLELNSKKCKVIVFSSRKDFSARLPITVNERPLEYVSCIKYLGMTIVSSNGFSFSASGDLCSFYKSTNAILNAKEKPTDEVLMQLLYANCIPILAYGCAIKEFPPRQMLDCNTAVNNAIRHIFTYHRWQSIRTLRENFGYKSLTDIFAATKRKFIAKLPSHHNSVINRLAQISTSKLV